MPDPSFAIWRAQGLPSRLGTPEPRATCARHVDAEGEWGSRRTARLSLAKTMAAQYRGLHQIERGTATNGALRNGAAGTFGVVLGPGALGRSGCHWTASTGAVGLVACLCCCAAGEDDAVVEQLSADAGEALSKRNSRAQGFQFLGERFVARLVDGYGRKEEAPTLLRGWAPVHG